MADTELGIHRLAQLLHESIVDAALHEKPVRTHARLQEEEEDVMFVVHTERSELHSDSQLTCPEFLNLEAIAPLTAASTSALSNTMKGAWPPSSMDAFFTVSAAIFSRI